MADPATLDQIDTPAVLIDVDRARANIARAQAHADAQGLALRPHIKTHKLPFWAKVQLAAGAVGITAQKLGEAEVMADAGIADIFLPYNIVGDDKLARLRALHERAAMSVTADSKVVVEGLARACADPAHPLPVLVECDTGMGRCGVQSPAEALALAQTIAAAPGLGFGGLMTYPALGRQAEVLAWLDAARQALIAEGLPPARISAGNTPDLWTTRSGGPVTEIRPGTYIYLDRFQVSKGAGQPEDCALTVLTTVVSHPVPTRAILDAGSKALSSDLLGLPDYGEVIGLPGARVTALSEEHGTLTLPPGAQVAIGDRLRVLPNHACVVSNLFDRVHLISGDRVIDVLPVAARGRVG
jgi:D-serine deaminase-like pyridoxal phosphate-dependent protein